MTELLAQPGPTGLAFPLNVALFGRSLRSLGIPVAPSQIGEALLALTWVELADRRQVFETLRAVFVARKEDLGLFETAFNLFWRHPDDQLRVGRRRPPAPRDRRPSGSFTIATYDAFRARAREDHEGEVTDRTGTFSDLEQLQRKRFADMTPEELAEVARLLNRLDWPVSRRATRRGVPDPSGRRVDLRRLLRESGRLGSVPARIPRRRRKEKPRPVVFLADVSGSMERYSRLVLRFSHVVAHHVPNVEVFVFGTRLSRITPQLRLRNVDRALDEAVRGVVDWAGGTRIGECVGEFNRKWGRRVLRRGAVVVVISDGCDRGDTDRLAREMAALRRRSHRLIWLNPYLGNEAYAARVAGMAAALPFVDDFLPIHNVAAMEALSRALGSVQK